MGQHTALHVCLHTPLLISISRCCFQGMLWNLALIHVAQDSNHVGIVVTTRDIGVARRFAQADLQPHAMRVQNIAKVHCCVSVWTPISVSLLDIAHQTAVVANSR